MRKYIPLFLIVIVATAVFFIFKIRQKQSLVKEVNLPCRIDLRVCQENILKYLKLRKDRLALEEAKKVLNVEPQNLCALWAKAEILRRSSNFKESEELLNQILSKTPNHAPSLISLSSIKYNDNKLEEAGDILEGLLHHEVLDRHNTALAYVLIGSINAKKASLGAFLKLIYAGRIKGFFEKAKSLAPDLSETHLGLGSFYLFAPRIIGGNLDKAIEELEYAVGLAPDFVTANVYLAQAYKKKGILEKYNFYIQHLKEIDPQNKILKEITH